MPNELTTQDILRKLFPGPQEAAQRDSSGQAWIGGPNRFALPRASQGFLERYRRPGDTTGFTPGANPEMEGLAADLGNRQSSWWEKVLAATGLTAGIVQGKIKGGKPAAAPRELDKLGFYSQALEAAKGLQRKSGPAQGFLNDLTKAGVKKAELQATGLDKWLEKRADAQAPVNREELVEFLRQNRVQVRETGYGAMTPKDEAAMKAEWAPLVAERERLVEERGPPPQGPLLELRISPEARARHQRVSELNTQINAIKDKYKVGPIKWKRAGGQNLLLDPENPSNRESVVHMGYGKRHDEAKAQLEASQAKHNDLSDQLHQLRKKYGIKNSDDAYASPAFMAEADVIAKQREALLADQKKLTMEISSLSNQAYREPHFSSVPNYLFHLRTGMYRDAQGRQVLLGDEVQSTRAQGIRESEAGPRDEGKIAELDQRRRQADADKEDLLNVAAKWAGTHGADSYNLGGRRAALVQLQHHGDEKIAPGIRQQATDHIAAIDKAVMDWNLASAEHRAATDAPSGHPLVNSMNQVDTTMLRRLIQQAVESKAEGLALTPGDLQNERYSLSNHVGSLRYNPDTQKLHYLDPEQGRRVSAMPGRLADARWQHVNGTYAPGELPGVVGKEVAAKLLAQPRGMTDGVGADYGRSADGWHTLHDLGSLEIGGAGMREYYDKTYPNVIEKELRRMDPQWPGRGTTDIPHDAGRQHVPPNKFEDAPQKGPFHYFPITPKIQEEVAKGLPLFSAAALAPLLGNLLQGKPEDDPEGVYEHPFTHAQ